MVITQELHLSTQGHCDIQDITPQVGKAVQDSGLGSGIVTVFCPGATGGVTTIEYESGVVFDLQQVLDEITPPDRDYRHHLRWHDDNGHSQVRAALIGMGLFLLTLTFWPAVDALLSRWFPKRDPSVILGSNVVVLAAAMVWEAFVV